MRVHKTYIFDIGGGAAEKQGAGQGFQCASVRCCRLPAAYEGRARYSVSWLYWYKKEKK